MRFRPHPADRPITGVVLVFGSNLAGRHGKGAALEARYRWGAIYGQGSGRQGQSYAIPTKYSVGSGHRLQSLALGEIAGYVALFLGYAREHPDDVFYVTRIGCGLAGYSDLDIAPLFRGAPENCLLPAEWRAILEPK